MQRVQKIIASSGLCSRRKAEELIEKGLVTVNGKKIKLGDKANPEKDRILVNGKTVFLQKKVYYAFYKPKNIICSAKPEANKKTIYDLLNIKERVFYAGRLDYDAEGLLILTNDGDFANRITHPRYETKKTYLVYIDKELKKDSLENLRSGIKLDDGKTRPAAVKTIKPTIIELTIHEGKKHIVKRMFEKLGYKVINLIRTRIADINLRGLEPGQLRKLSKKEIEHFTR
ncbi:rRNA pseudouridine synthase [Candidatus Woesearchaeota archaeon]|nr:rRNA pseudouridine synthase [Candidatus Woesearchaeota archaeon]